MPAYFSRAGVDSETGANAGIFHDMPKILLPTAAADSAQGA